MLKYIWTLLFWIASPGAAQTPVTPPPEQPARPTPKTPAGPTLTEIPLLDCAGLPCIDMTTGSGKNLRLLIDLGERNSYLSSKAVESLGLELHGLAGTSTGSAPAEVQQTAVPGARLGDLPMGDFPFFVIDSAADPAKPDQKVEPLPGDGVLTYGAFQNRLLELDYAHRVMRLSGPQDSAVDCPHTCSDLVIKHFGRFGPVTLTSEGFRLNGQPLEVQIDTLFTGTMLAYPASVEKLGLKKASKSKRREFFPFLQGGLKLASGEGAAAGYEGLELMEAAPLYFLTPEELAPAVQFDATVGNGLLSHAVVTFDFKGMHMWMDPAADAVPAPATPDR